MRLKQTLIVLFNLFLFFNCEDKVNYVSNNVLKNLEQSVSNSNNIFLDENNVTIKCHLAEVGDKAIINGIDYTVVNESILREMVEKNEDVTSVCTSHINDMSFLFNNKELFNQNIGSWDTSNVTNMDNLFSLAESFNQNLQNWDTSKVKSMVEMFSNTPFNYDISNWNTTNVLSMRGMFYSAYAFNQDIGSWDTSNVTDMSFMFTFTIFNQNLNNWCVTKIPNEPNNFSFLSSLTDENKPLWGSCP